MTEHETRVGWLDVSDQYDGEDTFIGTQIELYSDGPNLGTWENLARWFEQFDGKRVQISVKVLDA